MEALLVNGLLAFTAGILLNFTPCVLPVIPLKIRAVLQEIEGTTRPRILAAGALLLGSLTFFVLLGGATAYLGGKWGKKFWTWRRINDDPIRTSLFHAGSLAIRYRYYRTSTT